MPSYSRNNSVFSTFIGYFTENADFYTMIQLPPYLERGDTIGITCPASRMDAQAASYAIEVLRGEGFEVAAGKTVGTAFHNFSAADEVRRKELQEMLDDPGIHAILFGRGGYGMIRILDQLDFSAFKKQPKWLCGYSDITALHLHVHRHLQIATLHSVMCSGIVPDTYNDCYVQSLFRTLRGEPARYEFRDHPLNRKGMARGELIGGNLSLLANLSGTRSQPDTRGKILLVEDIGEYRYNIDRMMYNLKRAGWLDKLNGLLVGAFTDGKETTVPFGQTEYEIIRDKVEEYDFPVAFGFPAGHQKENYTLKLGVRHEMHCGNTCLLQEEGFLSGKLKAESLKQT